MHKPHVNSRQMAWRTLSAVDKRLAHVQDPPWSAREWRSDHVLPNGDTRDPCRDEAHQQQVAEQDNQEYFREAPTRLVVKQCRQEASGYGQADD
jgi:hypothetical protein